MRAEFLATAAFGLEGVVANELKRLGVEASAEPGGARFWAECEQAFDLNLRLRTADRVLMVLSQQRVESFEDLYLAVRAVPWERYLTPDAFVHVTGKCVRSRLMIVRDCQRVGKRAIADRLRQRLGVERLRETGAAFPVELAVMRDVLRVTLDMTGEALNRRGYRTWNGEAPLRETLAAALVDLSPWRTRLPFYDPCCGTGTLLVEAAIKASGMPPGARRRFACEAYPFLNAGELAALRRRALEDAERPAAFDIRGSDVDGEALRLCNRHIRQAGFQGRIHAARADLRTLDVPGAPGVFVANPPYGERLSDREGARALYGALGALLRRHPGWGMGVITADPGFERAFGRRADKRRTLYNARLECSFYIYAP